MKFLITGGTGFIGRNLIDRLQQDGHDLIVLHRPSSDISEIKGVKFVEGDIRFTKAKEIPKGINGIFHLAGNTSTWSHDCKIQTETNLLGAQNIAKIAHSLGVRLIYMSTIAVHGNTPEILNESSPFLNLDDQNNAYYKSKALGELEIKRLIIEQGLDAIIFRPTNVIGKYDETSWARILNRLYNKGLMGVPKTNGNFVTVDAVCEAMVKAFKVSKAGDVYVLGGESIEWSKFIDLCCETIGRKSPFLVRNGLVLQGFSQFLDFLSNFTQKAPDCVTPEVLDLLNANFKTDSSKAINELGYHYGDIRMALQESWNYLKIKKGYDHVSIKIPTEIPASV